MSLGPGSGSVLGVGVPKWPLQCSHKNKMKRFAGTVQQLRRFSWRKTVASTRTFASDYHRHTHTHTHRYSLKCCRYRYSWYENLPQTAASDELQMETGGKEVWRGGRGTGCGTGAGYQRTNEWASVLGIVTGLRIINSHELMCTAATATTTTCTSRRGSATLVSF